MAKTVVKKAVSKKVVANRKVSKKGQQDLSSVGTNILQAEKRRRTALQYKVTEIPDAVLDAELERRDKEWEESRQRISEIL